MSLKRAREGGNHIEASKKLWMTHQQLQDRHAEFSLLQDCGSRNVPIPELQDPLCLFDPVLLDDKVKVTCLTQLGPPPPQTASAASVVSISSFPDILSLLDFIFLMTRQT